MRQGTSASWSARATYQARDPEAVAARYRLNFRTALKRSQDYERPMARMKAAFISPVSKRWPTHCMVVMLQMEPCAPVERRARTAW